jgi:hypothetical protein
LAETRVEEKEYLTVELRDKRSAAMMDERMADMLASLRDSLRAG